MADVDQVTEPTLAEVIFTAVERKLRGVHTCAPGKVVAYDPTTQTATIQLTVSVETAPDNFEVVPPLTEVPIAQPVTATHYLHLPIAPGDAVLVHFFESDPSEWLTKGLTGAPPVKRRHGFFPVATLGASPLAQRLTAAQCPATAAVLGSRTGPQALVGPTQIQLGSLTAVDPVVLESKVKAAVAASVAAAVAGLTPPSNPALKGDVATAFSTFGTTFAAALIGALKVQGE